MTVCHDSENSLAVRNTVQMMWIFCANKRNTEVAEFLQVVYLLSLIKTM